MNETVPRIHKFVQRSEMQACKYSLPPIALFLFVVAWSLRGDAPQPPKAGEVRFAQLTDAHIFDDGYKQATPQALRQAANDREALHWAINQVNRAVASGTTIDFVAYTGDLGLQNVSIPSEGVCHALPIEPDPGLPQTNLAWGVKEIAEELNQLAVPKVFFVAGNNDIKDEKVTDRRFDCFMEELQKKVRSSLEVRTLRADCSININGICIAGLNSASFKDQKNYDKACLQPGADAALKWACPKPQMEALQQLSRGRVPVLLFTHVPDLIDPFRREPSWKVPNDIRGLWQKEVCGPNVIAVFAGHFHDSNRKIYGSNSTTKDLANSACVAQKTWVAPPLAMKNQEQIFAGARARGFLIATVADGKVAKVQTNWFDAPVPPMVQPPEASSGSSTKSKAPSQSSLITLVSLATALLLGLAFRGNDVLTPDLKAFFYAIAFVALTMAMVWYARNQLEITESAVLVALLLCPLLVYGVVSGRLTEFSGPGGWGAKFARAAIDPAHFSTSPIDVTSAQAIAKGGLPETQLKIQQIRSGKPIVMTMTLGIPPAPPSGYQPVAVADALRNLSAYPNFKFVVFLAPDGRLVSYIPGWLLRSALEWNSPQSTELIAAANRGDADAVRNYPGMLTQTISPTTSNARALEEMDKLELDAIPVVDPAGSRLVGVVARDRILSGMLLALARGAKA
jgi:CBS domain-containing protein/predicted MPP superfamily phosphohydrolase